MTECGTDVLIKQKEGGWKLIVIQSSQELRKFPTRCKEILGIATTTTMKDEEEEEGPIFISLTPSAPFPSLFNSNGSCLKPLSSADLPWKANVRVALQAVRAVFASGMDGGGGGGAVINTIKFDLTQMMMVEEKVGDYKPPSCLFTIQRSEEKNHELTTEGDM